MADVKIGAFSVNAAGPSYLGPNGSGVLQEVEVFFNKISLGKTRVPGVNVAKAAAESGAAKEMRFGQALGRISQNPHLKPEIKMAFDQVAKTNPRLFPKPVVPTAPTAPLPSAPKTASGVRSGGGMGVLGAFSAVLDVVGVAVTVSNAHKTVDHILAGKSTEEQDQRLNEARNSMMPRDFGIVEMELRKRLAKNGGGIMA